MWVRKKGLFGDDFLKRFSDMALYSFLDIIYDTLNSVCRLGYENGNLNEFALTKFRAFRPISALLLLSFVLKR
jgi:hypothetical protein